MAYGVGGGILRVKGVRIRQVKKNTREKHVARKGMIKPVWKVWVQTQKGKRCVADFLTKRNRILVGGKKTKKLLFCHGQRTAVLELFLP